MKNFYHLALPIQWVIAIILMVGGFGGVMGLMLKPYGLLLLPLLAPFLNLVSVPFFRLIGYYKYLNPYVLSTIQNDQHYDLHNIFTLIIWSTLSGLIGVNMLSELYWRTILKPC